MKCPIDGETLAMTERHGIEIDYCPRCRGVWLDRGELDKILERSARDAGPSEAPRIPSRRAPDRYDRDHKSYGYGHGKRRKSFLEELFD